MRVPIICARRGEAWAVRAVPLDFAQWRSPIWRCSWCGARVKVVA